MEDDPLTALYREHDLLPGRTHLAPTSFYQQLFLEDAALKRARRPTFTFHADKEMWQHKKLPGVTEFSGEARQSMLFKSIVTASQSVSIGPLEYYGNGHMVEVGNNSFLTVCKGDPYIPIHLEERFMRGLNRK
ncbi:hypothetical protein R3P38DRAFT_2780807 [Favolaschia claudopus]|uniref:Uncharacterized protein n=1 Tax=Favolaschia claudopus TaxID=2862362 RepID=A0AAW0B7Y7_9AGAR